MTAGNVPVGPFTARFPHEPGALAPVRRRLRAWLRDAGFDLRTEAERIKEHIGYMTQADGVYPADPAHLEPVLAQTAALERLVEDLRHSNAFLEAVMDRLRTGAIAVDRDGVVRAVNKPARAFVGLDEDVRGRTIDSVLARNHLTDLGKAVRALAQESGGSFEEVDLRVGAGHRIRVSNQALVDERGEALGRVVLFKEISHEPLTREFETVVGQLSSFESSEPGALRAALESALATLSALGDRAAGARIESANMSELAERVSRTRTAISSWLDVDEALAVEEFPDAQLLRDRMKIAAGRWPHSDPPPKGIARLARRVEDYYESGENTGERTL